ncbi:cilia- and flagella-associated protein 20-like [Cimex lectularius]|uniref:CFA20 domain-containing protein n=1 Tax=Cimex lectularius TaxID=79782 RepID=A0A8I6R935_CIMLE|nr:cilia- and flagella-associated protein 20-like [Cimex lectularius]
MFKDSYQNGLLSIFYSCGSKPLALWSKNVKNGYVKRITDEHVKSLVLEIMGNNVVSTYIACPSDMNSSLGIKLPFLVLIVKNLKKYFTFEIQILDDRNMKRRLRISNYQSSTKIRPFDCTMPIGLNEGWNQVYFNLSDFTRRAYGTSFVECRRVQVHANCRLRRVYFSDKLYNNDDLPKEYRLFLPVA